jgi:hypothetical protein
MQVDVCNKEFEFPKRIYNRPNLDHILYRIGGYSEFRKYLLQELGKNEPLRGWTHRSSDDPAFALLECACILSDILTFYQELYANEVYLRTAREKESIIDLVRLVGYQLSAGLGGVATFMIGVKGDKPVTLPPKIPIKAEIEGIERPVIFETKEECVCYPDLNKFYLYAPEEENLQISGRTTEFYLDNLSMGQMEKPEIKSGDRILIGELSSADRTRIINTEIITVDEVRHVMGRTIFTIKGKLKRTNRSDSVFGFKLKNVYKHFGHNAPSKIIKVVDDKVSEEPVEFLEDVEDKVNEKEFPLDSEVQDLLIGSTILVQGFFVTSKWPENRNCRTLTLIRQVTNIRVGLSEKGALSGHTSLIRLDQGVETTVGQTKFSKFDIRRMEFYEISGAQLILKALGKVANKKGSKFFFYGIDDDAVGGLQGRTLAFVPKNKELTKSTVIGLDKDSGYLLLDRELDYKDFPRQEPTTEIFGNLLVADQGESQSEVLDAGDGREEFQTLRLLNSPLTYFYSAKDIPPEVPELDVYVTNHLWKRVPSFINRKPADEIYIVRQDGNGNSWIQFGDGKRGRRLPSGLGNILAKYRIGSGATGKLKPETDVKALDKTDIIEEIHLYDKVSGGTETENERRAKEAAPRKIRSLGRLVSLDDYESEALSIAGVIKASSTLVLRRGTPMIIVKLLIDGGTEPDEILKGLERILLDYDRCRGTQSFPIDIKLAKFQYVYVEVDYGRDPTFLKDVIEQEIGEALSVFRKEQQDADSMGIFGVKQRKFGQEEYATRVEGAIQGVDGVVWAKVKAMYSLGEKDDPEDLPLNAPELKTTVICDENHILRLYHKHLKLNDFSEKTKEC